MYLAAFIAKLGLVGDALNDNVDFKLVLYVYQIYVVKLKSLFVLDLQQLLIRTNNSCEGSNSGLSRTFTSRPTPEDLGNYVACKFKTDIAKAWTSIPSEKPMDTFLRLIQEKSKRNLTKVLNFCFGCSAIVASNTDALLSKLESTEFHDPKTLTQAQEDNAGAAL